MLMVTVPILLFSGVKNMQGHSKAVGGQVPCASTYLVPETLVCTSNIGKM